jgi:hypothetical protein
VFDNPCMLGKHKQRQHDARKSQPMQYQGRAMEHIPLD